MERRNGRILIPVALSVLAAVVPLRAQSDCVCPSDAIGAAIGSALAVNGTLSDASAAGLFDAGPVVQQPAGAPPTPRHTGVRALLKDLVADVKHLPSRENLLWVGVGSGLALAVHPADERSNRYLVGNTTADRIFKPGAIIGSLPTLLGSSIAVYAVGRATDAPKVSHVGMDLIRAVAIAEGLTQVLKYSTRRERPDGSGPTSFPSGHAADTFAFATALERHLGWRYAVPGYIFASYVAASRLPADRHWLSDVVFGSAVGIIAGRTVTANETAKFPLTVAYVPGGAAVLFVRR
jgi:membrane-associated phospholipid phosphatase